ncbi:MAG: S-layer protein, partial [Candidatus Nanohalobium sp.]
VPEEKREAVHSVGSKTSGGTGTTVTQPSGWPDAAKLDTDIQSPSQDLILVGGPAVNDLTKQLADEGKAMPQQNYTAGQGHLNLIENAFNGNTALVVAGHSGEDTRNVAEFLANYGQHSDALEGESVAIDTETDEVLQ